MQHRAWVCLSTEDTGLSPYQKTETTFLNTKLLSSSQLINLAPGKPQRAAWATPGLGAGSSLPSYSVRHVLLCLVSRPSSPAAALSLVCRLPRCPVPRWVLALTGHGVQAQHAAHEVGEANPAGSIAVAQHHQAQQLRVGGQTCRGKRTGTRWEGTDRLWWPPAPCQQAGDTLGPPPCHAFLDSPSPASCLRGGAG